MRSEAERERRKAYQQQWYAAHRDAERAKSRERARAAREADPEGARAKGQAWRAANAEAVKARWDRWYRAHADDRRAYMASIRDRTNELARIRRDTPEGRLAGIERYHRRRARLTNSPGVSPRDWHRLVRRHGGLCAYCRRPGSTQDHVIPLARGGRHAIGNLLPACQSCNSAKGDRLLVEWLRSA